MTKSWPAASERNEADVVDHRVERARSASTALWSAAEKVRACHAGVTDPAFLSTCARVADDLEELAVALKRVENDEAISLANDVEYAKVADQRKLNVPLVTALTIPLPLHIEWAAEWRLDMRSFIALGDIALDDVGKLIRCTGLSVALHDSKDLNQMQRALRTLDVCEPFRDLAEDAARLQLTFGVYRDASIAHGHPHPVIPVHHPDGSTRLMSLQNSSQIAPARRERDGALIQTLFPDMSDAPIRSAYDPRITSAMERTPELDDYRDFKKVEELVERYGVQSPCPYTVGSSISAYCVAFAERCQTVAMTRQTVASA